MWRLDSPLNSCFSCYLNLTVSSLKKVWLAAPWTCTEASCEVVHGIKIYILFQAEPLVTDLKDLFQLIYNMKKEEDCKKKVSKTIETASVCTAVCTEIKLASALAWILGSCKT